jgi:hypothetical protein
VGGERGDDAAQEKSLQSMQVLRHNTYKKAITDNTSVINSLFEEWNKNVCKKTAGKKGKARE